MTATAELLHNSSSPRDALAPRPRKTRRRAFRRSDHGRFRFVELDTPIEPQLQQHWSEIFWERYAIPSGMALFWVIFTASNWPALRALLAGTPAPG